jgi:hypothetical protein
MSQLQRVLVLMLVGLFCMGGLAIAEDAGELVPLEIELPEPYFGGPPLDWWSTCFFDQSSSFRDREPYLVPVGTQLLSREKPVTSSATPLLGSLEQVTDGEKGHTKDCRVELPKGMQWIQLDLEAVSSIYAVVVWHFHEGQSVYFDVIIQISNAPAFLSEVTTIFNNDCIGSAGMGKGTDSQYVERYEGRLVPVSGIEARYVRLYSNGNAWNDRNHYVEVEVFGEVEPGEKSKSETEPELVPLEIELPEPFFGGPPL